MRELNLVTAQFQEDTWPPLPSVPTSNNKRNSALHVDAFGKENVWNAGTGKKHCALTDNEPRTQKPGELKEELPASANFAQVDNEITRDSQSLNVGDRPHEANAAAFQQAEVMAGIQYIYRFGKKPKEAPLFRSSLPNSSGHFSLVSKFVAGI